MGNTFRLCLLTWVPPNPTSCRTMKNKSKVSNSSWEPCHAGMIHRAAEETISRKRFFAVIAVGIISGLIGGGSLWGLTSLPDNNANTVKSTAQSIPCYSVNKQMSSYISAQIPDPELHKRITNHLMKCSICRVKYDQHCEGINCPLEPRAKRVGRPCQSCERPTP
jgi:hypothetical protein